MELLELLREGNVVELSKRESNVSSGSFLSELDEISLMAAIDHRYQWWRQVADSFAKSFPQEIAGNVCLMWDLWLPLATRIEAIFREKNRPVVFGIFGLQGTGKTTLTAVLKFLLKANSINAMGFSIDDIYKTHADRKELQKSQPNLIYRGPPGTHDIDLGLLVLREIKTRISTSENPQERPIAIPRFDKSLHGGSGDRIQPEFIHGVDVVLFEGWFVGLQPIPEECFERPNLPPPLVTDADRDFARQCNRELANYLPLWQEIDKLWVILPEDYTDSKFWRAEAEAKTISLGKPGMDDDRISAFVDYFWRSLHPELFIPPLLATPNAVDSIVHIDRDRQLKMVRVSHSIAAK
jgi:D-glycerate 3-kinase